VFYKLKARAKKAAIWARVTESVGQYNGGLPAHAKMMPPARALTPRRRLPKV
jgi:hypothetical protein